MPADRQVVLPIGQGGLNLRESVTEMGPGELVDALNWQIDKTGALSKRLGFSAWSQALPADALTVFSLVMSTGTTYILAHCDDGHVYATTDGQTWTSIDSGISTTTPVGYAQFNDTVYFCDGTNNARYWDGTTLTTSATIPKGRLLTVWRNRLWVAKDRTVYWSKINTPTDFSTYSLNTVSFPSDSSITGLVVGPSVGAGASGSDGVLVFTPNRLHRIYDDTDNVTGAILGGANVLVDAQVGCVDGHTIANPGDGRLWFLSQQGVYSTEGHSTFEESISIRLLMRSLSWGQSSQFRAFAVDDRYYLAYTPVGEAANTRVLEAYTDLPRIGFTRRFIGQHQWMAHDIPVRSAATVPTDTGAACFFADASSADGSYIRRLFDSGADAEGLDGTRDITATVRTGANLFGITTPKRLRRAELFGTGAVTLSVSPDLSSGSGESQTFDMRISGSVWGPPGEWGVGKWGGRSGATTRHAYYSTRGRYFQFTLTERSQDQGVSDRLLGYAGQQAGGAAVYSIVLKLIPLDSD